MGGEGLEPITIFYLRICFLIMWVKMFSQNSYLQYYENEINAQFFRQIRVQFSNVYFYGSQIFLAIIFVQLFDMLSQIFTQTFKLQTFLKHLPNIWMIFFSNIIVTNVWQSFYRHTFGGVSCAVVIKLGSVQQ